MRRLPWDAKAWIWDVMEIIVSAASENTGFIGTSPFTHTQAFASVPDIPSAFALPFHLGTPASKLYQRTVVAQLYNRADFQNPRMMVADREQKRLKRQ
jgi:hypothetical protein